MLPLPLEMMEPMPEIHPPLGPQVQILSEQLRSLTPGHPSPTLVRSSTSLPLDKMLLAHGLAVLVQLTTFLEHRWFVHM